MADALELGSVLEALRARVTRAVDEGQHVFGDTATRELLADIGIPFVRQRVVEHIEELPGAYRDVGPRVAMKVASNEVTHKSDAGFVELGVESAAAAEAAYKALTERARAALDRRWSIVLQEMAPPGLEVYVGAVRDETFGPLVIVGKGGTDIELWQDVVHAVPPFTSGQALELIDRLRIAPLIRGYRGHPGYDVSALAELVARVGRLVLDVPEIAGLDINPVRLYPDDDPLALDVRLSIARAQFTAPSASEGGADAIRLLLDAKSVVVVGASSSPDKPAGRLLRYLETHGYDGHVHPVNPAGQALGPWKVYERTLDVPDPVDIAVIAVPAPATIEALHDCADIGVRAAVVFASGFAEIGDHGARLQDELRDVARDRAVRLLGPNTIGCVGAESRTTLCFSQALEADIEMGAVSIVSQSGAIAGSLVSTALASAQGFCDWVTVGNQVDLDICDALEACAANKRCRVIALYLEGLVNGPRFLRAVQGLHDRGVRLVAFKAGVSSIAGAAVTSHSGVLAGSDAAYDAVFAASGVIRVRRITELLPVAHVLAHQPKRSVRSVAVVSTSGGGCAITADLLEDFGLVVARLGDDTYDGLRALLPPFAPSGNPVDLTAQGTFAAGTFRAVLARLCEDSAVDAVVVVITSVAGDDAVRIADEILAAERAGKVVLVAWLLAESLAREGRRRLTRGGITVFGDPADAVSALWLACGASS